jgi:hypothetical protein
MLDALKIYGGVTCDSIIVNLCTRWSKWSASRICLITPPWKQLPTILCGKLDGPQNRCERYGEEKNLLPLPGIELRIKFEQAVHRVLLVLSRWSNRNPLS